jgi:hypothetical protein
MVHHLNMDHAPACIAVTREVFGCQETVIPPEMALTDAMWDAMDTLSAREAIALRARFGFWAGAERQTYAVIGTHFGVTGPRIAQIVNKALRKMRHPSRSRCLRKLLHPDGVPEPVW